MITVKTKFDPVEFGWVSVKTPPQTHNNVVFLVFLIEDNIFNEYIGYYEDGKWLIDNIDYEKSEYEVKGWFPYPYTPHNH